MGHLELLLVENFKSWRGRQVIGPFKRFTCIIGPNGSGKSNVMDALSFVMGEKTTNLRVKNIQELIHGAHTGKPVSSSASVTIIYIEDSGEEKTFTRIIRGGCSEYHFGDKPVSRSVYVAQLENIGIIVKAQNCLVFQGTVESISMKKPKERTQFFEEISTSGEFIGEYEAKKKKLQKAEEDAQFHFNVKKNVAAERKHAKIEKEEAEHYQNLLEELKINKIQLMLFQLYYNEEKINVLNTELEQMDGNLSVVKDTLSHHENIFKAKKKDYGMLTRQLQQTAKELKSVEAILNQKRPQYIKAKENTSHHLKKLDLSKKLITDNEKQCSKQEDGIRALVAELADLDRAWKSFEKQMEEKILQKGRDIELENSQLDRYKLLKEQVRRKVGIMTQQLEKLQWEQKAEKERLAFEKRRHGDTQGNLKQIKEQIEEHKKRIEKLEEYTKTCMDCLEDKKQQEEALKKEIENTKSRMSEVNEELSLIRNELQNAGIDNHEGKRQQKRAEVLEHLKRLYPDSVFGRLLDLCHPIHKKYQLAVTKLFGRYMVAIVVASEKIAKDCIRFLKAERAEPETFLALDYLDIKPINERLREIKGCKMMIDVIKTQFPQLKKVIQFVCGNGLVCETVEEARHIAFGGPERRKAVALDGTLFLKSGVISGGSSDLKHKALCWDEKELHNLRDKRSQLVQELKELMKTLRKETDLKQIQTLVQGTNTRLKYSQNELEMIKKKHLATFYREQSQLQSELLNIDSQCTMLSEGINKQQQKIEEFQDKIDEVEDDIFQDFCEEIGVENIREFENKHVKQQQENDQKRLEFEKQKTRLNIQLEYSRNQLKKKLNNIDTLKTTIQKGKEDIDNLKKTEEECLKIVEELMVKQEQIKEVLATQSSNIEKIHIQIEEERKKVLAVDREVGKLQKEVVIIQGSLEQKLLEKHNLLLDCKVQDIDISLVLGSLEDIIEMELTETESTQATADIYEKEASIQIDYSPLREDLKALQSDKEVEAHLTLLLQQVASQENTLLKTTAPNLRAQENLKTVRDKFQESADVFEASRKEARICRQEFEQVKRRRYDAFSQCFEHISVSIDQIYKKLCRNNSAQAFLSPENPEEPYLDGISYNCVAPGKRFMPMDNLSGGEKCVAALALLFAVHSFRPAPFFVLDEVDAALDNTNIGKVSSYIKEQSQEQFQMIIISLKEEFYSKADALIGVYPEHNECMFSHVLTLDLSKYPDTEDQEGSRSHRKPRVPRVSMSPKSPQSR
ncbi:structural maintenance of chromosomes protein 1B [Mus musculus]|uniref:Structural maintenance of chromosomes protein 1B n=2 Tax=Mus musculus TaxID=10090 RepID=SMC1B_MOUSE|nr:structural maintenance of chromosomes protein 1B [Mus musculus]Q920F6.1 RecName: Full=Structural maintenance of chromosomes protein 1B; Short=SMC protein 1B; Short=SMC-1-beta; Short=SMC-1B [Mus musculus]AAI29801.1 Structural maintenance of chromosomes 1B [Mus musculus]AAL09333.1 structural maintenance of chromosomes 1beta [Mus musculus]EDL04440.1 structural maintenace of chromosomes 1B [Mus musculus]|eukprot:NP_536718.1 structural maintenance of chromosomes protein 1B [Mus musculus]